MRKLAIAMALASTAIASPALARNDAWYVGVDGGVMLVEDMDLDISTATTEFNNAVKIDHDKGFDMKAVVARLSAQLQIPVITKLPFGHVETKVCLPTGACVSLDVHGREVIMMWAHDHDHGDHAH